ncbi:hypothetical protein IRJ41_022740, partial [Triplophysa rosa]
TCTELSSLQKRILTRNTLIYIVTSITITNRKDYCPERLDGAEIHIGRVSGRYVNVVIPGVNRVLTLCELEVYGENVALRGVATQNVPYEHNIASNAIDGNKDSNYFHGSCSCTKEFLNPWWRLDLPRNHKVFSVAITNRGDAFSGAEIRIGNSLNNNGNDNSRCAVITSIDPGFTSSFDCNGEEGR